MELARGHESWMAGRHTGEVPFRIDRLRARALFLARLVLRFVFHRVLTVADADRPQGAPEDRRQGRAADPREGEATWRRPGSSGSRASPARATACRCSRTAASLDVANVIWCTGFHAGFSWIDLPIPVDAATRRAGPRRRRGHRRAGPLLRGAALPVRDVVDDDPRRRPRRRADRQGRRGRARLGQARATAAPDEPRTEASAEAGDELARPRVPAAGKLRACARPREAAAPGRPTRCTERLTRPMVATATRAARSDAGMSTTSGGPGPRPIAASRSPTRARRWRRRIWSSSPGRRT